MSTYMLYATGVSKVSHVGKASLIRDDTQVLSFLLGFIAQDLRVTLGVFGFGVLLTLLVSLSSASEETLTHWVARSSSLLLGLSCANIQSLGLSLEKTRSSNK